MLRYIHNKIYIYIPSNCFFGGRALKTSKIGNGHPKIINQWTRLSHAQELCRIPLEFCFRKSMVGEASLNQLKLFFARLLGFRCFLRMVASNKLKNQSWKWKSSLSGRLLNARCWDGRQFVQLEWSGLVWYEITGTIGKKNDLATSTKDRWSITMETPYAQISILDNEWSHLHGCI